MELASKCEAVLCCRVSPKQKQEVVSLVREQVIFFHLILFISIKRDPT
jgi:magnesium-transporting ATPase (P-type)